jgi:hypothetical protein
MPDGRLETGRIPNRSIEPRLFYHRHFMLTELLGSDRLPPEMRRDFVHALAQELCREHGALRVTLSKVTHRLRSMEWIRAGGKLDDPENYTEEPLGTFQCDPR